jgi:ribosomal-protein-serine acetyltransferase
MTIKISDSAYIRHFSPTDKEDLFMLIDSNREHLGTFMAWPPATKTSADTLTFINGTLKDGIDKCFTWGIYDDEKLSGVISLHFINLPNKKAEMGYWIGSKSQGKGLITNSVKALLDIAFNKLDLNRVAIQCAVDNTASANVPKRLGFTCEGVLRSNEVVGDRVYDHYVFSLLKSEYKS